MPNKDGTGPFCAKQGRGLGPCGRGDRRGFLGGQGRMQAFLSADEQKKVLQEELKSIEEERQAIEKKLKELG